MKKRIFISYSSVDKKVVDELCAKLTKIGIEYFRDEKDIDWGQSISDSVIDALRESIALLVIISPASLKSQWVPFETGNAIANKLPILPLLCHPSLDLPGYLSSRRYLTDNEQAIEFFQSTAWKLLLDSRLSEIESSESELLNGVKTDRNSSVFVFLRVPALQSGDLVSMLRTMPAVVEAAAVYSEYDVIACLSGRSSQIGNAVLEIAGIPKVKEQRIYVVDSDHSDDLSIDPSFGKPNGVYAYVVIDVLGRDPSHVAVNINRMEFCDYAFPLENENKIIVRASASCKSDFDAYIMREIQGVSGVLLTRSYITINLADMYYP
jgi:hypothetical protein